MNGAPQLPQYTFDPATQRYTLKTPAEQARDQQRGRSGLGALYDGGGDGTGMASSGGRGFSMSPETAVGMQNFGMAMQGIPSMATQAIGAVATGIPSAFGYATPSPVAAPVAPVETAIAPNPTQGLAAMNAQTAANQAEAANQAAVTNTAVATADAVSQAAASDTGAGIGESVAAADTSSGVSDSGGSAMGDSGAGIGGDSSGDGGGAGVGDGEKAGGVISLKRYEQGGLASLADKVESKGRGNDKMLVHMTPGEVAGLQYLAMRHGGSLTVNPETGLVEAGFLKNILPTLAGAALTIGSGGAINPYMSAAIVGGLTGLTSGSLEKGLFAGLGAFGGANLGAGLTDPAVTGTQPALAAAPTTTSSYVPSVSTLPTTTAPTGIMDRFTQAGRGLSNVFDFSSPQGAQAREAFIGQAADPKTGAKATGLGGLMGTAKTVGMAAAPVLGSMFSAEEPSSGAKPQTYIRPYGFDYKPTAETDPNFKFRTGAPGESTAEQRYFTPTFTPMGVFKAGTEPGPSFYGTPTQAQLDLYSRPKDGNILGLSGGGVASLRENDFILPADVISHMGNGSSDAGMEIAITKFRARPIEGDGDGMSDSIEVPINIEGKQKAFVAHEEALIPREMVAFLGGGSVEKGAEKLEKFMTRVRKARTGKARQAPEIDVARYMPA